MKLNTVEPLKEEQWALISVRHSCNQWLNYTGIKAQELEGEIVHRDRIFRVTAKKLGIEFVFDMDSIDIKKDPPYHIDTVVVDTLKRHGYWWSGMPIPVNYVEEK